MDLLPQPFHIEDYPALLELPDLGEFERTIYPLDVARERYLEWREGYRIRSDVLMRIEGHQTWFSQ